jgi:uncharacterized protein
MPNEYITVVSRKYDLSVRRTWNCKHVESVGNLLILRGEFAESVEHPDLGLIGKNTISTEYFWLDRWYNVFRFEEPGGRLRNFYCNVNMPPRFDGMTLDYVDLDIDLILWPDGHVATLDEDEFAANAARFDYPPNVRRSVRDALEQLKRLIQSREFPFESV